MISPAGKSRFHDIQQIKRFSVKPLISVITKHADLESHLFVTSADQAVIMACDRTTYFVLSIITVTTDPFMNLTTMVSKMSP